MKSYTFRDPPNIEDKTVHLFAFRAQRIRGTVASLTTQIFKPNEPIHLHQSITFGILNRMCECSLSTEILAMKGFTRDSAVLLASIFEMRTDMKYMALDTRRLKEWASHGNQWRKPWKLDKQLKELCQSQSELQAEQDM